jgi:hypothetical protein
MRKSLARQLARATVAVCVAVQSPPRMHRSPRLKLEQRIQGVTSGLIGGIVLKGEEHKTHTLSDPMKELNVPGVSIAVIHQGRIEWARRRW